MDPLVVDVDVDIFLHADNTGLYGGGSGTLLCAFSRLPSSSPLLPLLSSFYSLSVVVVTVDCCVPFRARLLLPRFSLSLLPLLSSLRLIVVCVCLVCVCVSDMDVRMIVSHSGGRVSRRRVIQ